MNAPDQVETSECCVWQQRCDAVYQHYACRAGTVLPFCGAKKTDRI